MTTRVNAEGITEQWCARGRHWVALDVAHFTPSYRTRTGFLYICRVCNLAYNRSRNTNKPRKPRVKTPPVANHEPIYNPELAADRKCPQCGLTLASVFFDSGDRWCKLCRHEQVLEHGRRVLRQVRLASQEQG